MRVCADRSEAYTTYIYIYAYNMLCYGLVWCVRRAARRSLGPVMRCKLMTECVCVRACAKRTRAANVSCVCINL